MEKTRDLKPVWPWFLLTVLISIVLRFYNLGTESLWIDEGNSLRDTEVKTLANQSKPLYYWLLTGWVHFTRSETGLRTLAVIFGVAGVILLYFIGREVISRRAGLVAALLMAVSPLHINHSQEIRMYTLLPLCAMASMYMLCLLMDKWTYRRAIGYVAASILTLLTHPLTVFLFAAQGLYALLQWRTQRKAVVRCLICMFVVFLLWTPWIPHVLQFGDHFVRTQKWAAEAEKLTPSHIPLLWGQYMYGEWNRLSYGDKLMLRYAHFAYAAGITLAALAVWFAGRRKKEAWLVGLWALLPLVLMILLSSVLDRSWPLRYLIYTSPALYLLLAYPVSRAPGRLATVLLIILLALPAMRLQRYYHNTVRPEWRQAVRFVESKAKPSDNIYIYKPSNRFVFAYYYHGRTPWVPAGLQASNGTIGNFGEDAPQQLADAIEESSHSWLIISAVDEGIPDKVQQELDRRGSRVTRHSFYHVDIVEATRAQQ